ncbi:transcriptional regulator [Candidatus Moduliflexus flocculans]|uniref:Transcriptional regulator n=1 Tax=Candidatus Moduliflexus flocculans TaxID=1499966 RepID=A0A081BS35_9BACT|nr:transcriptional regulator [Candidatus Moduliflexus flocculans]
MNAAEVNLLSIANAIEFIEAHLQEETSVAAMADAACYSLFHFCRMFNTIAQHTPYDYLMRRRLSNAAQVLLATDQKIIEIGFDYQFNSPETFARAFKRMFGMNPNEWRKRGIIPLRSLMPRLTLAHLRQRTHPSFILPELEEWPTRYFAGLMTWIDADNRQTAARLRACLQQEFGETARIYDIFLSTLSQRQKEKITPLPVGEGTGVGFSGRCHFAGVEIASIENCPPAFVIKTLPAGAYLRCSNPDGTEQRDLLRDYLYHTYLPQSRYALAFPLEIEAAQTLWIPVQAQRSQQINSA